MTLLATESATTRTSGIILLIGAGIMFIGAAIPFATDLGGEAWYGTPDSVLEAVSKGATAWRWANGLIAVAAVTTAVGLAMAVFRFSTGRSFALAGLTAFGIGAALEVTARIFNIQVGTLAATESSETPLASIYPSLYQFSEGLISGFILLGFAALILVGIAALQSGPAWLGTLLVALGAIGLALEIVGAAIPALVYMSTAVLGIAMVWNLAGPQT